MTIALYEFLMTPRLEHSQPHILLSRFVVGRIQQGRRPTVFQAKYLTYGDFGNRSHKPFNSALETIV